MDLATARMISRRPESYKIERLTRALSILMRWAGEPCTDREYEIRLNAARRVFHEIQYLMYELEKKAKRRYRPKRVEPTTPIIRLMLKKRKVSKSDRLALTA